MEMTQFLRLAVGLATALGGLHRRELIHKDVKPTNVLVNPATGQVRLMGFGDRFATSAGAAMSEPPAEHCPTWLPNRRDEQIVRSICGVTFYAV